MAYSEFHDFCDAIQTAIAPGGNVSGNVQIYEGRKYRFAHASPPAIFVYPSQGSFTGPMGPGGGFNPRILHTRNLQFEAHCWGVDYDNAEGLQAAFISALRVAVSGANYTALSESWADEGLDVAGVAVTTTFAIKLGLPEVRLPLAPMVSAGEATQATYTTAVPTSAEVTPYSPNDHL